MYCCLNNWWLEMYRKQKLSIRYPYLRKSLYGFCYLCYFIAFCWNQSAVAKLLNGFQMLKDVAAFSDAVVSNFRSAAAPLTHLFTFSLSYKYSINANVFCYFKCVFLIRWLIKHKSYYSLPVLNEVTAWTFKL